MPRGMSTIRYTHSVLTHAFRFNCSLGFPRKDCNGKKDCFAVFGCNNDHLFHEKYTVKFPFYLKSLCKY